MRLASDPNSPTWTIRFGMHGDFVATSNQMGDGANPGTIWGTAPTADVAAHSLIWYFLERPPAIEFTPPPQSAPGTHRGEALIPAEDRISVEDLLTRRGSVYNQHIAACRSAREILRHQDGDLTEYLAGCAAELNATDPQFPGSDDTFDSIIRPNRDHDGYITTVEWVPTRLIAATSHRTWGDFGSHRDHVPKELAEALRGSDDLDTFTHELFWIEIVLVRTRRGPARSTGSARTTTASIPRGC